jgi:pectate lyase
MLAVAVSCQSTTLPIQAFTVPQTPYPGSPESETELVATPEPAVSRTEVVPAFPGAEGFGANSVGGRGGRVIEVTNLNDNGSGTLRAAIEAFGSRIVVFRVAGTIELETALEIANPYITIAGQTAPGQGIMLKNQPSNTDCSLVVSTHDVIIRYIRVRPGPPAESSGCGNAIVVVGEDVIVDHSSFSWAIDQVASTWFDAHDITFQWSIIAEGLHCSNHEKGCHSTGMLIGSEGSRNISIHHTLFAHNHERNPYIKTGGLVDIVNNVIYNSWGTASVVGNEYGEVLVNFIGNYLKQGNDSLLEKDLVAGENVTRFDIEIYVQDNITPHRPSPEMEEWPTVKPDSRRWIVPRIHVTPLVTTTSAFVAYSQVLAQAGATISLDGWGRRLWIRDPVDERIVEDVRNGTGRIIDDPSEVGGWPELAGGDAPKDMDHDGMPDAWETRHGFDDIDPSDGPVDADGDGYTNVEEYLNSTVPDQ